VQEIHQGSGIFNYQPPADAVQRLKKSSENPGILVVQISCFYRDDFIFHFDIHQFFCIPFHYDSGRLLTTGKTET